MIKCFWIEDVKTGVEDLSGLLAKIEDAVESEVTSRYHRVEEYQQQPIEPGMPFQVAFGQYEILRDEFITAADNYRLWAYGGFVSTALAWLCDKALYMADSTKHPSYVVFVRRMGAEVDHSREPALSSLLSAWNLDAALLNRTLAWIKLRNRFIHSLGYVVDEADKLIMAELGIRLDSDNRIQLTADDCRLLLADIERIGVAIVEAACASGTLDAS